MVRTTPRVSERLLAAVTRIQPGEGPFVLLLMISAFLLLLSHYLLKVLRETLVLTDGSAELKSMATALTALALVAVVAGYGVFYRRFGRQPRRSALTVLINLFFASHLLLFAVLLHWQIRTPLLFYVWQGIYGVLIISHFWSFCADMMHNKTGQRLFPAIAIGASLGAWFGAALANQVFAAAGSNGILAAALLALLLATTLSVQAERRQPHTSRPNGSNEPPMTGAWLRGFALLLRSRYLFWIAVLVLLLNGITSTGDYILAALIKSETAALDKATQADYISAFYSSYFSWVNLLGFLLQTLLVSRCFRWFGVRGALFILPLVFGAGFVLLAILPVLAVARLALIAGNSAAYSLGATLRQALYLPLDREQKYLGKTTIDTFVWRLGDTLQFGLIFVGQVLLGWPITAFIAINVLLALLMLLVSWRLGFWHKQAERTALDRNAPFVNGRLPPLALASGYASVHPVPADLFVDPDPGDVLQVSVQLPDGRSTPSWIRFDMHQHALIVQPPAGSVGTLRVHLVATDVDGLRCEADLDIAWH